MKISAQSIPTPPAQQSREYSAQVLPLVSRDGIAPFVQRADAAEVIYLRDRYPVPFIRSAQERQAQLAVAVYESVRRLEQRDDLRSIAGIDVFA